ncbi:MAG: hypothetical protein OXP69_05295 [Spirochaetaceae bacterium]|nr:hypothetical protein [Spirochaetaceae bacterium]
MADERVDTDYSGRPLRPISELEQGGPFRYDIALGTLDRDGNRVARVGGQYYRANENWEPDFARPVDAPSRLRAHRSAAP